MPRTAITVYSVAAASGSNTAGTAIDVASSMYIPTNGEQGRYLITVEHKSTVNRSMTIKAGDVNPPAFRKDLGDLVIPLVVSTVTGAWNVLAPIESARHFQSTGALVANAGGDVYIDFPAATSGTIYVMKLPDATP